MRVLPTVLTLARRGLLLLPVIALGACGAQPIERWSPEIARAIQSVPPMYRAMDDGEFDVPAIPARYLRDPQNHRTVVDYWTDERPGTIVVDPWDRFLYLVQDGNTAVRYRIGVGEAGRNFSGRATVNHKREWPTWTPTPRMLREDPETNEPWRSGMPGGLENPLGARALYLYRNGRDTLYRIHGTHAPWSIGQGVSAGCIRMFNQDVIDLYERVPSGTRVVILRESESGQGRQPPGGIGLVARADTGALASVRP